MTDTPVKAKPQIDDALDESFPEFHNYDDHKKRAPIYRPVKKKETVESEPCKCKSAARNSCDNVRQPHGCHVQYSCGVSGC
jgi:hypothetical protein